MSIKIKIPTYLQDRTDGKSSIDVMGGTVRECLEALIQQYPALKGEIVDNEGILLLKWIILINSKVASTSDELSNAVTNGDVIVLAAMISGG